MHINNNSHSTLRDLAAQLEQPHSKLRVQNGEFYVKQSGWMGKKIAFFNEKGLLPFSGKHQQNNKAAVDLFTKMASQYGLHVSQSDKKLISAKTVKFVVENREHSFKNLSTTIADRHGNNVQHQLKLGSLGGFYNTKTEEFGGRYNNIAPPIHSQCKLENGKPLHANEISFKDDLAKLLPSNEKTFAMQAPTPSTRKDVFQLMAEKNIGVVVDLTNKADKSKGKTMDYLPSRSTSFGNGNSIAVTGKKYSGAADGSGITTTNLEISKASDSDYIYYSGEPVTSIKFGGWPDHGVIKFNDLINLVKTIHQAKIDNKNNGGSGNLLIHCSAGVGRTGTVNTAEKLYQLYKNDKLNLTNYKEAVNNLIADGRVSRGSEYVQNVDQYNSVVEFAKILATKAARQK